MIARLETHRADGTHHYEDVTVISYLGDDYFQVVTLAHNQILNVDRARLFTNDRRLGSGQYPHKGV